jgi:nucleotide-binding universal stress UspA family protein
MYGKILLPVDDLDSAGLAISNAKTLAGSTGAKVILLHIVSPENPLVIHDDHLGGVHAAAEIVEIAQHDEAVHEREQKEIFDAAARDNSTDGVEFSAIVIVGNAHNEISKVVSEQGIDLVIISTHGRRGVSRAVLGSVADEVMRDVDVPVMVVRRS